MIEEGHGKDSKIWWGLRHNTPDTVYFIQEINRRKNEIKQKIIEENIRERKKVEKEEEERRSAKVTEWTQRQSNRKNEILSPSVSTVNVHNSNSNNNQYQTTSNIFPTPGIFPHTQSQSRNQGSRVHDNFNNNKYNQSHSNSNSNQFNDNYSQHQHTQHTQQHQQ